MAGIAGVFHPGTPKPVERQRVARMTDALAHRGPDGDGVWTAPGVGLGHRRLVTIDLAGAAQPLTDGALTVVLDGAIHNFAALRVELARGGAWFRTAGDAEVLLHGWRAWGPTMLERLDGAFAFALHDADARTLLLARDRLGVRPLHWAELADGSVAFASALKGLLANPLVRRTPDLRAVADYLAWGHVPDDACLVAGVRKLPAGHFLLLERGEPVPASRRWWQLSFADRARGNARDLAAELTDRLRAAVRSHAVADVPVGALLAGDKGSAAAVALMAEASPRAVRTCTLGPDASRRAALVAHRFRTEHHAQDGGDGLDLLDTLMLVFDEPLADPAALATVQLSAFAREGMTVALSGIGAGKAFADGPRYRAYMRQEVARTLMPLALRRATGILATDSDEAYAHASAITTPELRTSLLSAAARRELGGYRAEDAWTAAMRKAPAREPLDRAQYADLTRALPAGALCRADRAGIAAGLEVRMPLLDHRLVQFVATLPAGARRRMLDRALFPYLPREILKRPEPVRVLPVGTWLSGPLADDTAGLARSKALDETGWFDLGAIGRLSDAHRAGRGDHGQVLWQLLMLERSWRRLFG